MASLADSKRIDVDAYKKLAEQRERFKQDLMNVKEYQFPKEFETTYNIPQNCYGKNSSYNFKESCDYTSLNDEDCSKFIGECLLKGDLSSLNTCLSYFKDKNSNDISKLDLNNISPLIAVRILQRYGFEFNKGKVSSVYDWKKYIIEKKFTKEQAVIINENLPLQIIFEKLVQLVNNNNYVKTDIDGQPCEVVNIEGELPKLFTIPEAKASQLAPVPVPAPVPAQTQPVQTQPTASIYDYIPKLPLGSNYSPVPHLNLNLAGGAISNLFDKTIKLLEGDLVSPHLVNLSNYRLNIGNRKLQSGGGGYEKYSSNYHSSGASLMKILVNNAIADLARSGVKLSDDTKTAIDGKLDRLINLEEELLLSLEAVEKYKSYLSTIMQSDEYKEYRQDPKDPKWKDWNEIDWSNTPLRELKGDGSNAVKTIEEELKKLKKVQATLRQKTRSVKGIYDGILALTRGDVKEYDNIMRNLRYNSYMY
jgi:hypothetical protein